MKPTVAYKWILSILNSKGFDLRLNDALYGLSFSKIQITRDAVTRGLELWRMIFFTDSYVEKILYVEKVNLSLIYYSVQTNVIDILH